MHIPEDDFYEENPPRELQQGDVLVGVPILLLPKSEELLLLRGPRSRHRLEELPAGLVEVVREQAIGDAFDAPEFVSVSCVRTIAVLMTQTCDLVRNEVWAVAPLEPLDESIDRGNLYGGKYKKYFPFPKHQHFDESMIDITDLRSIRQENVGLGNRIASLKMPIQQLLSDRFLHAMGRRWGHAKDEEVPKDGKYRCLGCNDFDMPPTEITMQKDSSSRHAGVARRSNGLRSGTCSKHRKPNNWSP